MNQEFETIAVRREDGIAILSLARPQARNAVNLRLCDELFAFEEAIATDASIRVVIIRAEGPVFCAGADLKEREGKDEAWVRERRRRSFRAYDAIQSSERPHIAIVNGALVGSGGEIAMACDFICASELATFRFPEAHWGTVGATQRLPRAIGRARAKELLLTGRKINRDEALRIGLVQREFPSATIDDDVMAIARSMAAAPALAMSLAKRAVDTGWDTDLTRGIAIERLAIDRSLAGAEWRAGVESFGAGRRPGEK
jgi:enoyl-CoA hydratase/carnithine racemase